MTNMKFYTLAALLAGAVALPTVGANAETYGSKAATNAQFKKVDADKSGTLNEAEFKKLNMPGSFASLDANSDSVLTLSELQTTPNSATGAGSSTNSSANIGTSGANDAGMSASGSAGTDNSGSGYNGRQ